MPVLGHSYSEKLLCKVQREPLVFWFVFITSCPITVHQWKEAGSLVFVLPLWVFIRFDKMLLSFSFSRLDSYTSQPFLILEMLQSLLMFKPFFGLSPAGLTCIGDPQQDPALQLSHQCWVEGEEHLLQSAANTPPNAAWDTINLCCGKGNCVVLVLRKVLGLYLPSWRLFVGLCS